MRGSLPRATAHREGQPPSYPRPVMTTERRYGARSSTAPLRDVLVKRPGAAFGRAFDDPAHGFLRPVDLDRAQREHDGLVAALDGLGVRVHVLDVRAATDPDLVYVFDPLLVTDAGAIPLRPGKPNRAEEPAIMERWLTPATSRPRAGSRRRARSRPATRSGFATTCSSSAGRSGRTTRGRAAGRDRRRRRPDRRPPVLEGPGRARPPDVRDLARQRRSRRRLPAAPAGRPVRVAGELGIRMVEVPEDDTRRSAATSSPSGRVS